MSNVKRDAEESEFVRHARLELERLYPPKQDGTNDYNGMLRRDILAVIELLSEQGHSGGSIGIVAHLLGRLIKYQPLVPLTGEEDEWNEVGDGVYQNNRCPAVFKSKSIDGGKPYYLDAIVFEGDDGDYYTNAHSIAYGITFPFSVPQEAMVVRWAEYELDPNSVKARLEEHLKG